MIRVACAAVVALAGAVLCTGCATEPRSTNADKAGGSGGPLVLRLAASDGVDIAESRSVRLFAAQVARLSHGKLRVAVTFGAAGSDRPDVEARTIELVRSGRFDLGWVAARAWDELGVDSFRALQTPFLITSYPVLDRVVTGPLAAEMLAGLEREDVVPLALVPGLLRHPVGIRRPLVSPSDYSGARIRDMPSKATDAVLHALGATPVHVGNGPAGAEIARNRIDGEELSLVNTPVGGIVTANVALFPKTLTLFAGRRAFATLSAEQQRILRAAARRTLQSNVGFPLRTALAFEGVLARAHCKGSGRIVLASDDELAALSRAARPAVAQLERDPQTKQQIERIAAIKASLPAPPPISVPQSCLGAKPAARGVQRSPSLLNGTYHRLLSAQAARAFGADGGSSYPKVVTTVLRNGKFMITSEDPAEIGTYEVVGDTLVLDLGSDVMRFTFARDPDGTLHLRPIPPMDRGDQFFMSGAPWRRVGPPIRSIP